MSTPIDYASAIEELVPQAQYRGIVNDEHTYEYLDWQDERRKPYHSEIIESHFIVLKKMKKSDITTWRTECLGRGYLTSFGFNVDIKPDDISNWTSTLGLVELMGFRIDNSFAGMRLSYPELPNYVIYSILIDAYVGPGSAETLGVGSTDEEVKETILNHMKVSLRDYHNDIQNLYIRQYKNMCIETGDYYKKTYDVKWELDLAVDAATTEEQLETIIWTL